MDRPHVVIVGAGFGGLAAAKELAGAPVDVTLVDKNNFHTFQPLLYQVATSGLASADVAYPVRGIVGRQENLEFRQATVIGADLEAGRLHLQGDGHEVADLAYDHLVLAAGATTNTFGIPGVEHHGFPLYNLADAVRLRNHVLERFEAADADPSLIDDGALTFVVVGGGPTGVEVAGALTELFHMVLDRDFKHLDVGRARVVLVEMLPDLLTPFAKVSRRHAREALEARGVEVRTGATVDRVRATSVELDGGELVPCHTLVWAAGVQANPVAAALGLPTGRAGRVEVAADLSVQGHPGIWAIGDVAAIADPKAKDARPLPQLAPVAIQSGRHAARQVVRRLDGRGTEPFHYLDKGTMATIGRSRAVAELPLGIKLRGFPAWLAWLGLHLLLLAGFRNRLSVFVNWFWNWLTYDRGPRLIFRSRE
ncbi:NAD(P)/FAD-dependent oxidoreductase [Aquihabitans sp. G128]|uniref:NAD(P)/FAD-dependent oxidoreductase n=1 Tax=Aquihabitans sp. G128 TaxID=2849779 RepID=UPI001C24C0AF|nr:NAD(P)/FAD-dependent oxidoreductase [Aquihabitans sp. G128]QXC63367.1 NAD(P)/FAD-dependent oxidoreductase [Aquihabitans sp. G128]